MKSGTLSRSKRVPSGSSRRRTESGNHQTTPDARHGRHAARGAQVKGAEDFAVPLARRLKVGEGRHLEAMALSCSRKGSFPKENKRLVNYLDKAQAAAITGTGLIRAPVAERLPSRCSRLQSREHVDAGPPWIIAALWRENASDAERQPKTKPRRNSSSTALKCGSNSPRIVSAGWPKTMTASETRRA